MDVERATGATLHQHLHVVHPGVVGPQVASTDEPHATGRPGHGRPQAVDVRHQRSGRELHHARGRAQHVREARLERTEVDTMRMVQEYVEAEPTGVGTEALAVRAGAEHEVDDSRWARPLAQQRDDLVDLAPGHGAGLVGNAALYQRPQHQVVHEGLPPSG